MSRVDGVSRREVLKVGIASVLTIAAPGWEAVRAHVQNSMPADASSAAPTSTTAAFTPLPFGAVRPQGWILAQMRRDLRSGFAGRLNLLCEEAASDIFSSGRTRPEKIVPDPDGGKPHRHPHWWNGESEGNWRCGFLMMACLTGDPKAMAEAKAYVDHILASQDADGYIGIFIPSLRYKGVGELWTQACLFRGILAYAEATGSEPVFTAIKRAVDRTIAGYGDCTKAKLITHDVMYTDVLEQLHARTGDKCYLDFGELLYRSVPSLEKFQEQPAIDGAFQTTFQKCHGAHVAESMRIPFWLWASTGDPKYLKLGLATMSATNDWVMPSGALVSDENVDSRPYPWGNVGYEYCTIFERGLSLIRAGQYLGDGTEFDAAEHSIFNAAQGSSEPDGSAILYCSYENRLSVQDEMGKRQRFSPTHQQVAVCCVPNATRVAPYYVGHAWMKPKGDEPALAATLYGPCEVKAELGGTSVRIVQKTNYPYSGDVEMTVHPEKPASFCLWLRDPAWSKNTRIVCAGAEIRKVASFWQVRKAWSAGDTVTIHFDQAVREVPALEQEVALQYGPLLYVLPVKGERKPVRSYEGSELTDYFVAKDEAENVDYALPADQRAHGFGFTPVTKENADPDYPLDHPGVVLEGSLRRKDGSSVAVTLYPIGAKNTELRLVTFPITAT
jgi:hypothetical protein